MSDEKPHPPSGQRPARLARKGGSLWSATRNSLDGLAVLLKERAARRELLLILAAATMYVLLPGMYTLALLALAFALLAVEALNTAIEVLCDHVTPDIHPAIKKAKDLGSAAIFIISCAIAVMFALALFHALHR